MGNNIENVAEFSDAVVYGFLAFESLVEGIILVCGLYRDPRPLCYEENIQNLLWGYGPAGKKKRKSLSGWWENLSSRGEIKYLISGMWKTGFWWEMKGLKNWKRERRIFKLFPEEFSRIGETDQTGWGYVWKMNKNIKGLVNRSPFQNRWKIWRRNLPSENRWKRQISREQAR